MTYVDPSEREPTDEEIEELEGALDALDEDDWASDDRDDGFWGGDCDDQDILDAWDPLDDLFDDPMDCHRAW